jgi:hypothetical protein
LKERAYGLSNPEGNHGEDIKDYYYHLANTPTHSFMRGLYKYPQSEFPYDQLVRVNGERGRDQPEYELVDTGIFEESRYFDVIVEYAKAAPDDILIRIRVVNRGPVAAPLTLMPTLWLRNTWSWGYPDEVERPIVLKGDMLSVDAKGELGPYSFACNSPGEWIFTDNETNSLRIFAEESLRPFHKDGFHRYVVDGELSAINPAQQGTKASRLLRHTLASGEEWIVECRLRSSVHTEPSFGEAFQSIFRERAN